MLVLLTYDSDLTAGTFSAAVLPFEDLLVSRAPEGIFLRPRVGPPETTLGRVSGQPLINYALLLSELPGPSSA